MKPTMLFTLIIVIAMSSDVIGQEQSVCKDATPCTGGCPLTFSCTPGPLSTQRYMITPGRGVLM